ncbi:MAG: hypothetical protein J1E78_07485 [Muribaculaceae bacterium]|nr:hypothetical protein [Muribaculaceae bacterium]
MKFSIIYASLRPEISEQISLGLIFLDEKGVDIRYSRNKLSAIKPLFPKKQYKVISSIITNLKRNKKINSESEINYLSRYSNNMISLSPLKTLDLNATRNNKETLFKTYVYNNNSL